MIEAMGCQRMGMLEDGNAKHRLQGTGLWAAVRDVRGDRECRKGHGTSEGLQAVMQDPGDDRECQKGCRVSEGPLAIVRDATEDRRGRGCRRLWDTRGWERQRTGML